MSLLLALCVSFSAALGAPVERADFAIDWQATDCVSFEASGGVYDLLTVVGQPVVGAAEGAGLELVAGFLNPDSAAVPVELLSFQVE